jgi:hypothetical protein
LRKKKKKKNNLGWIFDTNKSNSHIKILEFIKELCEEGFVNEFDIIIVNSGDMVFIFGMMS